MDDGKGGICGEKNLVLFDSRRQGIGCGNLNRELFACLFPPPQAPRARAGLFNSQK